MWVKARPNHALSGESYTYFRPKLVEYLTESEDLISFLALSAGDAAAEVWPKKFHGVWWGCTTYMYTTRADYFAGRTTIGLAEPEGEGEGADEGAGAGAGIAPLDDVPIKLEEPDLANAKLLAIAVCMGPIIINDG